MDAKFHCPPSSAADEPNCTDDPKVMGGWAGGIFNVLLVDSPTLHTLQSQ